MKRLICYLCLLFPLHGFAAVSDGPCSHWNAWFKPICRVWKEGNNELYLSGYAWHNRYTYSPEKIRTYNETAWGGGLGKGRFDEKGNWHGLYAIAFLDSHKNLEPAIGYAYLKTASLTENLKAGLGFTVLVTSRPDIQNNLPIPGILPWTSIIYKRVTLAATYIPGTSTNGNVLFLLGKYTF